MTKKEIVEALWTQKPQIPKQEITELFQMSLELITDALEQGQKVELRRFGVFELQTREERLGRNPAAPEREVIIPRRTVVKFKAGKEMKDRVSARWGPTAETASPRSARSKD